jgi:hypothetical protein
VVCHTSNGSQAICMWVRSCKVSLQGRW